MHILNSLNTWFQKAVHTQWLMIFNFLITTVEQQKEKKLIRNEL